MVVLQSLQRNAVLAEGALHALFAEHSFPLYDLIEYQLGWRDEAGAPLEVPVQRTRLHASLCLLACQALGGDPKRALPAATAVELVYQFTQVHADIEDGSQRRYNRPTVWWIWGPAQAINVGDGLHALGRLSLLRLRGEGVATDETLQSVHTLDTACLRMCEGLHQDLVYLEGVDITPDGYLKMAREKAGALLGCALELGGMAAAGSTAVGRALKRFGEDLGVAFQVQEDIQTLWGEPLSGEARGTNVLNKKKAFPIIQALDKAPLGQKRDLATLLSKRALAPPDMEEMMTLLDGLGARASAQREAQRLHDEAVGHLAESSLSPPGQEDLSEVARWLALREGTP